MVMKMISLIFLLKISGIIDKINILMISIKLIKICLITGKGEGEGEKEREREREREREINNKSL